MPPKNTPKLDPATVYFQTPEGLQHYTLDEAPDIEAETEWPKENPYIRTATGATLTAELDPTPDGVAFLRDLAAEASAAWDLARKVTDCCLMILSDPNNKRAWYLARHGKKFRTRKKNAHRLAWYVIRKMKEDTR